MHPICVSSLILHKETNDYALPSIIIFVILSKPHLILELYTLILTLTHSTTKNATRISTCTRGHETGHYKFSYTKGTAATLPHILSVLASTGPVIGEKRVPSSKSGQDIMHFSSCSCLLSFVLLFLSIYNKTHIRC